MTIHRVKPCPRGLWMTAMSCALALPACTPTGAAWDPPDNHVESLNAEYDFRDIEASFYTMSGSGDEITTTIFMADYPFTCQEIKSFLGGVGPAGISGEGHISTVTIVIIAKEHQTGTFFAEHYLDIFDHDDIAGIGLQFLDSTANHVLSAEITGQGYALVHEFEEGAHIRGEFEMRYGEISLGGYFDPEPCDLF